MIRAILNGARRLDETLQARLGRPYNILLSIGLVSELVKSLRAFPLHALEASRAVGGTFTILIELALLLHQLGSLSHRFHRGRKDGARDGLDHGDNHEAREGRNHDTASGAAPKA